MFKALNALAPLYLVDDCKLVGDDTRRLRSALCSTCVMSRTKIIPSRRSTNMERFAGFAAIRRRLRIFPPTTQGAFVRLKPISQLRFDYDTTTIRRCHDAFDYDGDAFDYTTEVIEITICVRFDCDTTTTRLRRKLTC